MSYRTAAEAAYVLARDEDAEVAKLGVMLLSGVADKNCYSAMLCMVYLHDTDGRNERDIALGKLWAARAKPYIQRSPTRMTCATLETYAIRTLIGLRRPNMTRSLFGKGLHR